ncbi:MAG: hypothetical protein WCI28_09355 [Opitutaceae bacterium]|jgi:flagellar motility protein MotE (MotC chaperone)|nr:hypothetical protein [Opitutaceae bacterium]
MNKLANPYIAAALALLVGVGLGLSLVWRSAVVALEHAVSLVPHHDALPVEARERGWNFWTIEIENLATELKGERDQLHQRTEQLAQRETQLAAERQELNKVRSEIESLRTEIATKVIEINADEAKNIRTLAQTYTNLSPMAAVAIIKELDDTMVVKILAMMKPDIVAPIFEQMSRTTAPENLARRAAHLSDRLRLMKSKPATNP